MYNLVASVSPKIFRGYDIRGVAGEDLSEDVYYTLGRAYATFLHERRIEESTVGRDNRLTSEAFARAFIAGLNDGGIHTIDLGLSLSQIVYFSSYEFKTKGSAMVTASHNPGKFNGLKLGVGYSDTMLSEEIQYVRELIEAKRFVEGHGTNRTHDVYPAYKQDVLKHFALQKKWRVVIDACNTTSGKFYPDIFRAAGCDVVEQNTTLDGNFPLGVPDPTEFEVLERLARVWKEAGFWRILSWCFPFIRSRMSRIRRGPHWFRSRGICMSRCRIVTNTGKSTPYSLWVRNGNREAEVWKICGRSSEKSLVLKFRTRSP
jgi:phosphomannomutase/phosphoglucomutase